MERGGRGPGRAPRRRASPSWSARCPSRSPRSSPGCSTGGASPTTSSTPSSTSARPTSSRRPGGKGSVTVATNMAGRGVDILLGGNPEYLARQEMAVAGVRQRPVPHVRDGAGGADGLRGGVRPDLRQVQAADRRRARPGGGARRPVRPGHRAARVPPDRQPAPRPVRPAGRPRRVAVLPVAGRRPHAAVRIGPDRQGHGPVQVAGGRAHRGEDGQQGHRERAEERGGAATSRSGRTSSSTTRS